MQFFGKFGKIVCWHPPPPTGLASPPTGNPGSAPVKWKNTLIVTRYVIVLRISTITFISDFSRTVLSHTNLHRNLKVGWVTDHKNYVFSLDVNVASRRIGQSWWNLKVVTPCLKYLSPVKLWLSHFTTCYPPHVAAKNLHKKSDNKINSDNFQSSFLISYYCHQPK